ncbi:NUMOD4 motif-containing HNH endonuclease [Mycolicibacterium fortuitum]|uniref:NUMOD4 motif-containing HNH endonuclease n=1 Tax=Mycolicibacterium fortuitum TaxID=1766 RepID=UPI003BF9CD5F
MRQHQPAPNPITGTSREGLAVNATQPPEEWRPAVGHEGAYEVSDQGRVRSLDRMVQNRLGHMVHYRGQLLKPRASGPRGKQYLMVSMTNGAPAKVHHLVAAAFIGPNPGGMHVCHNDGNRWNNRAENLRYGTASENNFDIVSHGRHRNAVKTRCPQGHSLSGSNLVNFELPYRKCRACAAAHAYVQRNPAESFEYHADRYYKRYAPREVA